MPTIAPRRITQDKVAFAFLDEVSVSVSNVAHWSDELVVQLLVEMTTLADRAVATASLIDFRGEVLGPRQRKITVEWLERERLSGTARTCIITESPLVRGAMTAYAWLTRTDAAAFSRAEALAACQWSAKGASVDPKRLLAAYQECTALVTG